jgi:hypothetical protein
VRTALKIDRATRKKSGVIPDFDDEKNILGMEIRALQRGTKNPGGSRMRDGKLIAAPFTSPA